jgi:hypothetical protein
MKLFQAILDWWASLPSGKCPDGKYHCTHHKGYAYATSGDCQVPYASARIEECCRCGYQEFHHDLNER